MSTRAGFKFGALVGLFASPIFAVLRAAQIVASGPRREFRTMIEKLQQAAAGNPDVPDDHLALPSAIGLAEDRIGRDTGRPQA